MSGWNQIQKNHSKTYGDGHFDGCLVGFDGSDIEIDAKKWVSYVFWLTEGYEGRKKRIREG